MKELFWPSIDTLDDAKKTCRQAAGIAFLISTATAVITFLEINGTKIIPGWSAYNFIDAGIFLGVGIFLLFHSRLAALAGLLFYAGGQIYMMKQSGRFNFVFIVFTLSFMSAVRGTFAYHQLKGTEEKKEPGAPPQAVTQALPAPAKKKSPVILILLMVLGLGLGAAGFFVWKSQSPKTIVQSPAQEVPAEGQVTFKLKDGRSVTGRVLAEDEVYYTLETTGGRQEIVIKEDLAPR